MHSMHVKKVSAYIPLFLLLVSPVFVLAQNAQGGDTGPSPQSGGLVPCGEMVNGKLDECTWKDVVQLVNNLIDFGIKVIALPISALLFAYAGFKMLTSGGKQGELQKAKSILLNTFIGLVLTLSGWLVVSFITRILTGGDVNSLLG